MNKRSFVDLTALLDVVLILLFAALLNMATRTEATQEQLEESNASLGKLNEKVGDLLKKEKSLSADLELVKNELEEKKRELASLYGARVDEVDEYKDILSRISVIRIEIKGEENSVLVQGKASGISLVKEAMLTEERQVKLRKSLTDEIETAIRLRERSDILFIRLSVIGDEVYKYAYDYMVSVLEDVIAKYGADKVMFSKVY